MNITFSHYANMGSMLTEETPQTYSHYYSMFAMISQYIEDLRKLSVLIKVKSYAVQVKAQAYDVAVHPDKNFSVNIVRLT